jgi:hypothetical protein
MRCCATRQVNQLEPSPATGCPVTFRRYDGGCLQRPSTPACRVRGLNGSFPQPGSAIKGD